MVMRLIGIIGFVLITLFNIITYFFMDQLLLPMVILLNLIFLALIFIKVPN